MMITQMTNTKIREVQALQRWGTKLKNICKSLVKDKSREMRAEIWNLMTMSKWIEPMWSSISILNVISWCFVEKKLFKKNQNIGVICKQSDLGPCKTFKIWRERPE